MDFKDDIPYIDEIDIKGKRILIRVDFNVPLDEYGNITDDARIRAVLPTINYCLDEEARIILVSHMGRPNGKKVEALSLEPVARRLSRLLGLDVRFLYDSTGPSVEQAVNEMKPGDIALLENLRFNPREEVDDDEFSSALAKLCDVYIDDAFAVAHRKHASIHGIVRHVKESAAGFLMRKELTYFTRAIQNPLRPFAAVIGGAKVSDKLVAIKNLLDRVDKLVIGGGMAYTFIKAWGYDVGKSLVEDNMLDIAKDIFRGAREKGIKIYLPVDCVVADRFDPKAETKVVSIYEIPKYWIAMDIGPATNILFGEALRDARTIIWNGPMGVFEMDAFARGTYAMVSHLVNSHALTIVGGGDTDIAVHKAGETANISYVSTGGGAFLMLLEGKELPALDALKNSKKRG